MHPALFVYAIISMAVVAMLVFLILFEPGLEYCVKSLGLPLDGKMFARVLGALADAEPHEGMRVKVLTNGDVFYAAELDAIRNAKQTIHLERYIFRGRDEIGRRYVEALAERARAGVKVKVVLDYIGSFTTWDSLLKPLRDAGARVEWYQPIRWYTFKRFNNRTHRDLLIVDGRIGFVGGAGVADWWAKATKKEPQWRDSMVQIEGKLVTGLQATFADNWLESSGEILSEGAEDFPECCREGQDDSDGEVGIVVISSPSIGRATRARILFQMLLANATKTIDITSPYFLPDRSARREMIRAVKERGVRLRILVPGKHADHLLTRSAGRRRFGELLEAGAEIHEYQPSMIHAKVLIIDDLWSVVGTTNFDNRSFGINDEVNVAFQNVELAQRLKEDFERDLSNSKRITLEMWRHRPITERITEGLSRIVERQS